MKTMLLCCGDRRWSVVGVLLFFLVFDSYSAEFENSLKNFLIIVPLLSCFGLFDFTRVYYGRQMKFV